MFREEDQLRKDKLKGDEVLEMVRDFWLEKCDSLYEFEVNYDKEERTYIGRVKEITGIFSVGGSPQEALCEIKNKTLDHLKEKAREEMERRVMCVHCQAPFTLTIIPKEGQELRINCPRKECNQISYYSKDKGDETIWGSVHPKSYYEEEEEEDFDTTGTDSPTCPYCGFEDEDNAQDYIEDTPFKTECSRCGKEFYCYSETVVTFYTYKE